MELNAAGVRVPRQESQTPSLLDKARPLAEWARPEDCERGEVPKESSSSTVTMTPTRTLL